MAFVKTRKLSCYNHNLFFVNRVYINIPFDSSDANLCALHSKICVVDYFFFLKKNQRKIIWVSLDFAKWNNHSVSPIINIRYILNSPSYPSAATGIVQSEDK